MILDKAKMAHEWAMKHGKSDTIGDRLNMVRYAWGYADAMQAEADKREKEESEKKRADIREMLKANNTFIEREGQHFDDVEWQPDWSQAPLWAEYFAMDDDGEFYYFEESPSMAGCSWQQQSHGEVGETFNHSYKGNWQDSLRKRPQ